MDAKTFSAFQWMVRRVIVRRDMVRREFPSPTVAPPLSLARLLCESDRLLTLGLRHLSPNHLSIFF